MLFLKSLIFVAAIEGGLIPMGIFVSDIPSILDPRDIHVSMTNSYYVRMETAFRFCRYFEIGGAVVSYQYQVDNFPGHFYPFRIDYSLYAQARYRYFSLFYRHGCDHEFTPYINEEVHWKMDFAMDRIGARFEIETRLFQE